MTEDPLRVASKIREVGDWVWKVREVRDFHSIVGAGEVATGSSWGLPWNRGNSGGAISSVAKNDIGSDEDLLRSCELTEFVEFVLAFLVCRL